MRKIQIQIVIVVLSAYLINSGDVSACTEISITNKFIVSARNFDFPFGDGIAVITPRGIPQTSAFAKQDEKPLSWTNKYGNVTFNVKLSMGKNIPAGTDAKGIVLAGVDGMNEYGFKVGSYYLEPLELPAADKRPTIATASLLQYLLDNFKTVEAAVADVNSGTYRVISVPADIAEIKTRYYMHDPSGDSAIVEYIKGKLKIHRNPPVPVLSNTFYDDSLTLLKSYEDFGGTTAIPGGTKSMDRFVRGAYYLKHLMVPTSPEEAIVHGFDTIQIVSVSPGFEHGCTQWTIVSDIANKRIYFRTMSNPRISSLDLNMLDFSEGQPVRYLEFLQKDLSGDVRSKMTVKKDGI